MIQRSGEIMLRYSVVLILIWIGAMKFTAYEAETIQPLIASNPVMSWMYGILSVRTVSNLLGTFEIVIALMIAMRPVSPRICTLGSALAACTFLTTLSFIFTLPGWEPALGGFPALSPAGGSLIKDLLFLGASVWSLGESLKETR
ncbi:MAG: DUF417 family protein [Thermodesulfobacteriota bacterium]